MQMIVPREKDGLMLSRLLTQEAADVPQWAIREVIKKRDVRIDGVRISGDVRVSEGQEIRVFWPKSIATAKEKKSLPLPEIVFEDDHVLLINKPQGIASQNEDHPLQGDTALAGPARYTGWMCRRADCYSLPRMSLLLNRPSVRFLKERSEKPTHAA